MQPASVLSVKSVPEKHEDLAAGNLGTTTSLKSLTLSDSGQFQNMTSASSVAAEENSTRPIPSNRLIPFSLLACGHPSGKMFVVTTVAIALKDEDQKFIEEVVKSGRYSSESEVVAEALSELKVREAIRLSKMDELRAKVQVGIGQADRGEFVEFTAEDVKAEGRRRLSAQ